MVEIYYVEDDRSIASLVKEYLGRQNCRVSILTTMADARRAFLSRLPDVALVDWNMPDGQGDAFCRWLRSKSQDLPIIFLTVRGDSRDIVSGLQNGADDYVAKPFELEVLYSRICAVLRRVGNQPGQSLTCDSLSIDLNRMTASCDGRAVNLSPSEYQLLLLLMRNKGRTVTRETILKQIWDSNGSYVNDNTLTVTMKRLREKLNQPPCIKTVRSFGYRMEDTE